MIDATGPLRISDFSVLVPVSEASLTVAANICWGTSVVIPNETAKQLERRDIRGISSGAMGTLIQHSILTNQTPAQERSTFQQVIVERGKNALAAEIRAYLMPSYDCNLKCVYCFQHKIRRVTPSVRMSKDAALAAVRYLDGMFRESMWRGITLYGGEPLIPENRSIIEVICSEARLRGFSLMAATSRLEPRPLL
jgi:uncharacterized protein